VQPRPGGQTGPRPWGSATSRNRPSLWSESSSAPQRLQRRRGRFFDGNGTRQFCGRTPWIAKFPPNQAAALDFPPLPEELEEPPPPEEPVPEGPEPDDEPLEPEPLDPDEPELPLEVEEAGVLVVELVLVEPDVPDELVELESFFDEP
jgi:hypothetical protein